MTKKVSGPSTRVSLTIGTVKDFGAASPSAQLRVPLDAVKSLHANAVVLGTTADATLAVNTDTTLGAPAMPASAPPATIAAIVLEAIPPDLAAAEIEALLRSGLEQFEGDVIRNSTRRLASAWERGALDEIEGYAAWCGCLRNDADRRLMARLNDGRNANLADGIAAVHARGAKVFAAVGALHMTGEQGLPKLLAQRGFTLERIAFAP